MNEDNGVVTLVVEIQCGLLLVNQSFVVTLTLIDGSGSGKLVHIIYICIYSLLALIIKHLIFIPIIHCHNTCS